MMHPSTAATILARHTVTVALDKGDLFIEPIMAGLGCPELNNEDWDHLRAAFLTLAAELGSPTDRDVRDAKHTLTERGWANADGIEVDAK